MPRRQDARRRLVIDITENPSRAVVGGLHESPGRRARGCGCISKVAGPADRPLVLRSRPVLANARCNRPLCASHKLQRASGDFSRGYVLHVEHDGSARALPLPPSLAQAWATSNVSAPAEHTDAVLVPPMPEQRVTAAMARHGPSPCPRCHNLPPFPKQILCEHWPYRALSADAINRRPDLKTIAEWQPGDFD